MRIALIGLALLHGIALLVIAWVYWTDETMLTAGERSFGSVMLGLAGTLMLIGTVVIPRTPALASVPFGLAGLLTVAARAPGHDYLLYHGGWSLVLALAAIMASGNRLQTSRAVEQRGRLTKADTEGANESTAVARDRIRRIQRFHARERRHATGRADRSRPSRRWH